MQLENPGAYRLPGFLSDVGIKLDHLQFDGWRNILISLIEAKKANKKRKVVRTPSMRRPVSVK
jgi:hypothetical protein